MSIRFKCFAFDPLTRELRRRGHRQTLRPKTAQLLEILLSSHGRVLSKQVLIRQIWGHDCIEQQALFQLIADIRRVLNDPHCIATYPNRGYRWLWPAHRARARWGWATAACAAALIAAMVWLRPPQPRDPAAAVLSPAMAALSQGLQARQQGDVDGAVDYLRLAVEANPNFAAARLELAVTLRLRGDFDSAQQQAYDALSAARIVGDHYLAATAHVLLSQLRWAQGDVAGALQLNAEASRIATDHGHICAAQISTAWQQWLALALRPGGNLAVPEQPSGDSIQACAEALGQPQTLMPSSGSPGPALTCEDSGQAMLAATKGGRLGEAVCRDA